jgi:hypothetical protein
MLGKTIIFIAITIMPVAAQVHSNGIGMGNLRPINPVHLTAKTLSANKIQLAWNNIAGSGVERMVIWYRPFVPVPLVYDISALYFDSLTPQTTDTVIIADRLIEKARYYFGAQVYQDGLWSLITDSASASDSTFPACCGLDSNFAPIIIPYMTPNTQFVSLTKSDQGYRISYGGYNREDVIAVLYSVKGQAVARLRAADYPGNIIVWNYRDSHSRHVTNGMYLLEIKVGRKVIKQRILVAE